MPGLTGYHALLERLRKTAAATPQAFLTELQAAYGLSHVFYADLARDGDTFLPGRIIHGHDPDLERIIRNEGLSVLHPLFDTVANLFGPSVLDPPAKHGTGESANPVRSVCPRNGPLLVFPLVPSRPGIAFFACNPASLQEKEDDAERLLRDLAALAGLFHATQLSTPAPPRPKPSAKPASPHLTPREREVLQWVASGKTYWEIARILDISERTVRHFMAECREKLDAVSNKQAVAKAVACRLIDVAEPRFTVPM